MNGENIVVSIYTAPAQGEPMAGRTKVSVQKNKGIIDDRYGLHTGFWSDKGRNVCRDITIISTDEISDVNKANNAKWTMKMTRRNILLAHLTFDFYKELIPGRLFYISGIPMKVVEICTPCNRPSKLCGINGFEKHFSGRGGIRAEVLESGEISIVSYLTFS